MPLSAAYEVPSLGEPRLPKRCILRRRWLPVHSRMGHRGRPRQSTGAQINRVAVIFYWRPVDCHSQHLERRIPDGAGVQRTHGLARILLNRATTRRTAPGVLGAGTFGITKVPPMTVNFGPLSCVASDSTARAPIGGFDHHDAIAIISSFDNRSISAVYLKAALRDL